MNGNKYEIIYNIIEAKDIIKDFNENDELIFEEFSDGNKNGKGKEIL